MWWPENFNSRNYWSFNISEKIEQIANSCGIENLYYVVIIDEGQDFMEYWYESINYLLSPGGRRYIFMDEDQNINQALSRVSDVEGYARSNLDENCRNTKNIAEKLSDILKQEIYSMEGVPEGDSVQIISYRSDTEQQTLILKEIRNLLQNEKVSPNDILILMNTNKGGSCLAGSKAIDNLPLVPLGNNGVLRDNAINYTHIKTFKGLEANIVFIIDTDKAPYNQQVLYTQASRIKHLLYIFEKQ